MTNFKSLLIFISIYFFICSLTAQISEVLYKIEYNQLTELYDCKIVIQKGNASTALQRTQLNSQYSIVVPTGATVSIVESLMPLRNNQNLQGTEPTEWYLASTISSPISEPECDYYGIIPILSPVGYYNTIQEGDEIILFSMKIEGEALCDRNVRLYNIDIDPLSSSPGMMGGDFRNGIAIGGLSQLYIGNQAPTEAMIASMDDVQICSGDCIIVAPELECLAFPLTYQWSTGEQTSAIEVCPTEATVYEVTITDGNDETTVIENKIDVIDDGTNGCNGISTATIEENAKVSVYPNPAADIVQFVSSSTQRSITLVDVYGRVLAQQQHVSSGAFRVDQLSIGSYFLVFDDGEHVSTERFVKGQ